MGPGGVGFFGFLLVGLIAGFISNRVMNREGSLLRNLFVGVVGALLGGFLGWIVGIRAIGFLGAIVISTAGAILFLWLTERYGSRRE